MNKYNARQTGDFASTKEQRRHNELLMLQRTGKIHDLRRQVKFVLIPTQREPDTVGPRGGKKPGKLMEKECAYFADFVYITADGREVVEDVKGYKDGQAYALFVIKRKLMLWVHGIRIKEV